MSGGVRRIVLMTLGWEDLPKSVSVEGTPAAERLREPVPAVLLECDGGWLLLDTGFNTALIRDLVLRRRFHGDPAFTPVLPGPGEPLEEALARAGIELSAIHAVAVSHLHNDHAEGLKHFAGRVPVHAQRAELEYGLSGSAEPEVNDIFRIDFDDPPDRLAPCRGRRRDRTRCDGRADSRSYAGPSELCGQPGQPCLRRGFVFAFDAADLSENIEREVSVGSRIGASAEQCAEQIRKLKRIAAERGYRLVPGHDPVVWPALTAELAADGAGLSA